MLLTDVSEMLSGRTSFVSVIVISSGQYQNPHGLLSLLLLDLTKQCACDSATVLWKHSEHTLGWPHLDSSCSVVYICPLVVYVKDWWSQSWGISVVENSPIRLNTQEFKATPTYTHMHAQHRTNNKQCHSYISLLKLAWLRGTLHTGKWIIYTVPLTSKAQGNKQWKGRGTMGAERREISSDFSCQTLSVPRPA